MSHGRPSELAMHQKYYGHKEPGPPTFKAGRLGAPWRHIKQTNGFLGNHIMFVDGVVKEKDIQRFPPYGYYNQPEPEPRYVYMSPRRPMPPTFRKQYNHQRQPHRHHSNRFQQHARNGMRYWYDDKPAAVGASKQSINNQMRAKCVGF